MSPTIAELVAAARRLPRNEQLELAEVLLVPQTEDDAATIEQYWILEAERRWDRLQRGEVTAIDGETALAALEARLA